MPISVLDIAELIGAKIIGDSNIKVTCLSEIHKVEEGSLMFVDNEKYYSQSIYSAASAIIIDKIVDCPDDKALLIVDNPFDASSFEQTQQVVAEVMKEFGKIDILINNAGVTRDNLLMRMSEDNWDEVMNNNLKSVFNFTKAIMRPMLKARSGSIINVSSIVGLKGNAGQANYAASKAGVIGFTKSIAQEVGSRSIRCNAIAPGFVATDMTDNLDDKIKDLMIQATALKRFGSAEEIANIAIFLASDLSSYITGETLNCSGGML